MVSKTTMDVAEASAIVPKLRRQHRLLNLVEVRTNLYEVTFYERMPGKPDHCIPCAGKIVSDFRKLWKEEQECYEDVRAFNAPSECAFDVHKQYERKRRALVQAWESALGMTWKEIEEEIYSRTGNYRNIYHYMP